MTEERRQKLLHSAEGPGAEPFSQYNHMKVTAVDDGTATVELELQPDSLNCWGTPHGGILFTLSDVACGMAILTTRMEACVTVSGTIDCVNAGPASGKLIATGRVQKAGGKLVFCDSEIRDETGNLITTGHTVMYFTGKQLA